MSAFIQDLRYGVRTLVMRPGFTIVATLVLALGIGATTTVFSVADGVLLRPLPYPDPDRLVVAWESNDARGLSFMNVAPPNLEDWRARSRSFEAIGAWTNRSYTLAAGGGAEQIHGASLTREMLDVLKVSPQLGRVFIPEEFTGAGARVALLSDGLWRRMFAADPGAVGQSIVIDEVATEIIGVMPAGFNFAPPVAFEGVPAPRRNDLWTPLAQNGLSPQRGAHYLLALGRLAPGVDAAAADRELRGIADQLASEYAATNAGWSARVVPFTEQVTGDQRPAIIALGLAVALVLLLACANVAALVLTRGITRRRELAIRGALGATGSRLARQLLTESLVLAALGSVAGSVLAAWMVRGVRVMGGPLLPRLDEVAVDGRALLFAAAAAFIAALLFGMLPAVHASRGAADWLKQRGGSMKTTRLQSALVVVELSLSLVLLSAAALLGASFVRLISTDPGFTTSESLTAKLTLPRTRYPDRPAVAAFLDRTLDRLRALPGVTAAGAIDAAPLADDRQGGSFTIEGETPTPGTQAPSVNYAFVTPGYFAALGIPVLEGRDFSTADTPASVPVIIVNQAFARRFFGDASPIGRRIRAGFNTQTAREIIAVVGDERHVSLGETAPPGMYTTFAQVGWARQLTLAVRTTGTPSGASSAVRAAVAAIDPQVPLYEIRTMEQIVADSVSRPRFTVVLIGLFAAVALMLAAVGVYGVMSQAVAQRLMEFGVRLALGAEGRDLGRLVLVAGARLAAWGVALGVPIALLFGRILSHLLPGIDRVDPLAYAGVAVTLALTALVAALVPAYRASRLDPIVALRAE